MLNPGTRLGPYEIQSLLGAGGMGEVYKALDTRLDRTVAIKILPQAMAADAAFRERFEREARTISQLSHPHICALYDIGEAPLPGATAGGPTVSTSYLVMELLEGETLAARLEKGALKLDDALKIAGEIVSALDRAHDAGVVHRDLKPGNVMLTRAGAKLLDFGLAKKTSGVMTGPTGAVIQSAASAAVTAEGVIVGTFQYMAPEQLEGAEADARADIFSFGAILYEMVTGHKAFEGKTPVSLISAILKDEPAPISAVMPIAPHALDRIVRACLAKDPDARFRSAHDLAMQLRWVVESGGRADAPASVAARQATSRSMSIGSIGSIGTWLVAAGVGVAALAGGVYIGRHANGAAPSAETIQFTMSAPDNSVFAGAVPSFAISPDGRRVVFVATVPGASSISSTMLFVRSLGSLEVTPVAGTERPSYPFWSPDSRFIAFFAAGKLKKVQVPTGSVTEVCDAPTPRGGTWSPEDVIVFAPTADGPLLRVSAMGGATSPVTALDSAAKETAHHWPYFLPDGRHFLYQAAGGQQPSTLKVGVLDAKEATTIGTSESMAAYSSGHVFFWRDGNLMAMPFDAETRHAAGEPFRVAGPVGMQVGVGNAAFAVSPTGVLIHARGNTRPVSRLAWIDRAGKQTGTAGEPGEYFNLALSPNEQQVAVTRLTGSPENRDIWLIDLARHVTSRLTSDPADDRLPLWSPDGTHILFGSIRNGATRLYQMDASGSRPEEEIVKLEGAPNAIDWSRDGQSVLYFNQLAKTGFDLFVLPLAGDKKPVPFQQTTFNETDGAFSPDSKWVAYTSDESGREEVYAQPFSATGPKSRISVNGGTEPSWRGDGRELFFLAPDGKMMAVTISTAKGLEAGDPQELFSSGVAFTGNRRQYAVTRDGQRFLVNVPQQGSTPTPLTVVVNWHATPQK